MENIKKLQFYCLDYQKFEELINNEYNLSPEFKYLFTDEESLTPMINMVVKDFKGFYNVKKEKLFDYDKRLLNEFLNKKQKSPNLYISCLILIDLCNKDIIPEGNYLITTN